MRVCMGVYLWFFVRGGGGVKGLEISNFGLELAQQSFGPFCPGLGQVQNPKAGIWAAAKLGAFSQGLNRPVEALA